MRDPKRIEKCCKILQLAWEKNPDLRFGQLVSNTLSIWQSKTGKDPFFPEDKEMFNFIVQLYNLDLAVDEEVLNGLMDF